MVDESVNIGNLENSVCTGNQTAGISRQDASINLTYSLYAGCTNHEVTPTRYEYLTDTSALMKTIYTWRWKFKWLLAWMRQNIQPNAYLDDV